VGVYNAANKASAFTVFSLNCLLQVHVIWKTGPIPLALGSNTIIVTAGDSSGETHHATIVVNRFDTTPPTVSSTSPANGAIDVATTTTLRIVFSESIEPATLSPSSIVLKEEDTGRIVGGVISYAAGVASFIPTTVLSPSRLYSAAVTTAVKDIAGNSLATEYRWSFTTGLAPGETAPTVISKSPVDGSMCVPTEAAISARFSEEILPQTLNTGTFLLKDATNASVSGTVGLGYGTTGYFFPAYPLTSSTNYTAMLTTGVTNLAGNPLVLPLSWTFTTQPAGNGLWNTTTLTGAPSPRVGHTAVWTGTRMIVWGGTNGTLSLGDGARYDPVAEVWSPMSNAGAPESRSGHVAVMAGSKMIIWGGVGPGAFLNSGALYDPVADTWSPMSAAGAPSPRQMATAVWTGTEMIVWGGANGTLSFGDGARYNPSTDTWSAIPAAGAPSARQGHTAIWTGSSMLVWGGSPLGGPLLNTGGIYTPSSNSWASIPLANAPSARSGHAAVWTGEEMLVWGGRGDGTLALGSGGRFKPSANSWQPMSELCAPLPRYGHVGIWTGTELLVWGGGEANGPQYRVGGRYAPVTDTWQAIPLTGTPGARMGHAAIWDGSGLILWGGRDVLATYLNSGGRFQPQ
jgi:N-acetylneuraminic acid mutarotase